MSYQITFTENAKRQYSLIKENDFTLEGKELRIQISGKKCEGFTYDIGFDDLKENDQILDVEGIKIFMQPFTAEFCKSMDIDWIQDPESGNDGFNLINRDQESYQYKFYKDLDLKL